MPTRTAPSASDPHASQRNRGPCLPEMEALTPGAPVRTAPEGGYCEPDYLALVEAVVIGILDREARGAERAITQDDLTGRVRRAILADGAAVPVGHKTLRRRVEEAVSDLATLTDIGVCSGSGGVFIAETVEELDRGLATLRRHAVSTFRRRQGLKRARARLLGQAVIGEAA